MTSRIGLDIDPAKIIAILVDPAHKEKGIIHHDFPRGCKQDKLVAQLSAMVDELKKKAEVDQVESICIGIAASVDNKEGHVHFGPGLGVENFPLGKLLTHRFDIPVFVDNNVNCMLLGEATLGAAKGYSHVVGLFVGSGIGSAIIAGGKLIRGARGVGAEAGHMIFIPGGRLCTCGKRGCYEAYAGGEAMKDIIAEAVRLNPSSLLNRENSTDLAAVRRCKAFGDTSARKVWEEATLALKVLVSNLVILIDPEIVLLGGKMMEKAPEIQNELQEFLVTYRMHGAHYVIPIIPTALGDQAIALGATCLPEEARVV